jgi:sugar phosphate isomerase/epimerase
MSLHRCFSSLGCPELSLDAVLALAEKHAVPLVELRALGGTVDLGVYLAREYGSPANLAARMAKSRVRVAALNASLHLVGGTEAEREQLTALAPWADALGAGRLRVFDGGRHSDPAAFAAARETVSWWRDSRDRHGWNADLMVETHDSLLTGDAIRRFVEAVPDIPILWDAHHTWRKGGEDPALTWPVIRPHVAHVHVKDSVNLPGPRHPFTYVLPGEGEFPIRQVVRALLSDDFAGPVSLEWEKLWHPQLPSLDEALTTAAKRNWW